MSTWMSGDSRSNRSWDTGLRPAHFVMDDERTTTDGAHHNRPKQKMPSDVSPKNCASDGRPDEASDMIPRKDGGQEVDSDAVSIKGHMYHVTTAAMC